MNKIISYTTDVSLTAKIVEHFSDAINKHIKNWESEVLHINNFLSSVKIFFCQLYSLKYQQTAFVGGMIRIFFPLSLNLFHGNIRYFVAKKFSQRKLDTSFI